MSANLRVGFIGAGKMASALAQGFIKGQAVKSASHVSASCPIADKHLLEHMKQMGCQTFHCNKELMECSDVVILAVKPQIMPLVLPDIKSLVAAKLMVSIAAGVKLSQLQADLNPDSKIVRLMPNTPCIVREGVSVFCSGPKVTKEDSQTVKQLFGTVGQIDEVKESMIDAVTGVSGSGPAYMYLIIEAMADGGVKQGLPRDLAYKLAAQTMVGAGRMVLDTNTHPAVLKDEVCSPGGTTITALDMLEKSGLRTSIMQAVEAATKRCTQIS